MDGYAKLRYGSDAHAVLVSNDAYGWRISYKEWQNGIPITRLVNINMQDVADTQYGPGHSAAFGNFSDPYSWYVI